MSNLKKRADEIVHGFFIGGLKDGLQQPNLTKEDLIFSIESALRQTREEAIEDCAKICETIEVCGNQNDGGCCIGMKYDCALAIRALGKEPADESE